MKCPTFVIYERFVSLFVCVFDRVFDLIFGEECFGLSNRRICWWCQKIIILKNKIQPLWKMCIRWNKKKSYRCYLIYGQLTCVNSTPPFNIIQKKNVRRNDIIEIEILWNEFFTTSRSFKLNESSTRIGNIPNA